MVSTILTGIIQGADTTNHKSLNRQFKSIGLNSLYCLCIYNVFSKEVTDQLRKHFFFHNKDVVKE